VFYYVINSNGLIRQKLTAKPRDSVYKRSLVVESDRDLALREWRYVDGAFLRYRPRSSDTAPAPHETQHQQDIAAVKHHLGMVQDPAVKALLQILVRQVGLSEEGPAGTTPPP